MSPGHAPPYGMLPSGTGFTALFSTGYAFAALDDQGAGSLNSRTFMTFMRDGNSLRGFHIFHSYTLKAIVTVSSVRIL